MNSERLKNIIDALDRAELEYKRARDELVKMQAKQACPIQLTGNLCPVLRCGEPLNLSAYEHDKEWFTQYRNSFKATFVCPRGHTIEVKQDI